MTPRRFHTSSLRTSSRIARRSAPNVEKLNREWAADEVCSDDTRPPTAIVGVTLADDYQYANKRLSNGWRRLQQTYAAHEVATCAIVAEIPKYALESRRYHMANVSVPSYGRQTNYIMILCGIDSQIHKYVPVGNISSHGRHIGDIMVLCSNSFTETVKK